MTTIAELVERASRRYADRVAVVDGDREPDLRRGRRPLDAARQRARAARPPRHGLAGRRCSWATGSSSSRSTSPSPRAGKVKAPINPRLTDDERSYILANCGAEVLVTERVRARAGRGHPRASCPSCATSSWSTETPSYGDLLASQQPAAPTSSIDPDEPSMILHTSGTTGRPKGATTIASARGSPATLNMLLDEFIAGRRRRHGARRPDVARLGLEDPRVLHARRPQHHAAQVRSRHASSRRCATSGGTSTFVVPTMIRMLLDAPSARSHGVARIRNITYGGAPMPSRARRGGDRARSARC